MKLRNLAELAGIRKKPKKYGYTVNTFDVGESAPIRFAEWNHPKAKPREFNQAQTDAYRAYLKAGDFCLNVGAHCGDSSVPMALAVGKTGCVLALEPNPYVYHVLEKNARLNTELMNIKPVMAAAANSEGIMEFEYSDPGFCNGGRHEGISALRHGHAYKQEVFCINLAETLTQEFSDYLAKLKLIKVDAEGYDLYILKAIEGIIDQYHPIVKAEIFKKTSKAYRQELHQFFTEKGYDVFLIEEEPIKLGKKLDAKNMMDLKHFDICCVYNR